MRGTFASCKEVWRWCNCFPLDLWEWKGDVSRTCRPLSDDAPRILQESSSPLLQLLSLSTIFEFDGHPNNIPPFSCHSRPKKLQITPLCCSNRGVVVDDKCHIVWKKNHFVPTCQSSLACLVRVKKDFQDFKGPWSIKSHVKHFPSISTGTECLTDPLLVVDSCWP